MHEYDEARSILGEDFISPEDVMKVCEVTYATSLLQKLRNTVPSIEKLTWCRQNDFALIAGPPRPVSTFNIRLIDPSHFYEKRGGWFLGQSFIMDDKANPGWLMLSKVLARSSVGRDWNTQLSNLSENEEVPNCAELAWCIIVYASMTSHYLFPRIFVRTSSLDSAGHHVYVGTPYPSALDKGIILSRGCERAHKRVGIASKLRMSAM